MFSELIKNQHLFIGKKSHRSADIKPLKLRLNAVGLQCFVLTSKLEHVV